MSYSYSRIFLICFSLLLLSCSTTDKTNSTPEVTKENVKVVTETTPAIIGGVEALYQHLSYPNNNPSANITLQANILVGSNGKVKQISFNDKQQYPKYKEAARQAIYAVRFVPGKRNGKPVDMFITIPVKFNGQQK